MNKGWSFKRSVDQEMIIQIKACEWLDQYISDTDLFFAIRDGYANFYYMGNSILKLSLIHGKISSETHYKYLLDPSRNKPYVNLESKETFQLPIIDPKSIGAVEALKKASKPYAGSEKAGVHKIIKDNNNIVDVEIAFSQKNEKQNRIDFCALRNANNKIELCFFECKHFANKEIRSLKIPKVSSQLERYRNTIKNRKNEIHSAYSSLFESFKNESLKHPAHDLMMQANSDGFSISNDIRLVIFGFDDPQKEYFQGSEYYSKLIEACEGNKDLLLMKGNAKDFKNGISTGK